MPGPSYHGRTHIPGGSDPIPGQIAFDVDNQGGYLKITTNDADPDSLYALQIINTVYADTYWYPSDTTQDAGAEWWLYGDGGSSIGLSSGGGMDLQTTNGPLAITALTENMVIKTTGGTDLTIEAEDTGYIYIGAVEATTVDMGHSACTIDIDGDTVSIDSNAGNLNLNANGSGNDVRIKLSGTGAGDLFQIRDSANNVLLEVRGDGTFHIETGAAWVADL